MVARTLITTAYEYAWPENTDDPVLFLGEWCKRYSRKHIWQRLDYEVAPYHWDDRKKLSVDYKYISKLYEELLLELADKLNYIHSVDYSIRYWRIILGPWLGYFVQVTFDRWFMLKQALGTNKVKECIFTDSDDPPMIPNDMQDFIGFVVGDKWNNIFYNQLIEMSFKDNVNIKYKHVKSNLITSKNNPSFLQKIKSKFKNIVNVCVYYLNLLFLKPPNYFFISTYLPKGKEIKLKLQLRQLPDFWGKQPITSTVPDTKKRQWGLSTEESENNSFEYVVRKLIPWHIPTTYLEGYARLKADTDQICWPKKPKAIFTSNAYLMDDFFKAWSAEKVENNIPLVVGQHGGNHGMTPFSFFDDHQYFISDIWLSWGWKDKNIPTVYPIGNLLYTEKRKSYNPKGKALMVEVCLPRYSYALYSVIISGQWLSYFNDQQEFLRVLPKELRKQVVLRLKKNDHGWDQVDRWQDVMPEVELDLGNEDIYEQIKKCRIYISTYNATTYLESLSMNIPTIIFWDPRYWELKEEVKPYFDLLISVGIFYETPTGAANQMIKVWDNVTAWWESDEVQNARKQFIYEFARTPDDLVHDLKLFFENLDSNIMIARN